MRPKIFNARQQLVGIPTTLDNLDLKERLKALDLWEKHREELSALMEALAVAHNRVLSDTRVRGSADDARELADALLAVAASYDASGFYVNLREATGSDVVATQVATQLGEVLGNIVSDLHVVYTTEEEAKADVDEALDAVIDDILRALSAARRR